MIRLKLYFLAALSMGFARADVTYNVAVDSSVLVGHPAGPFSMAFQLTDGSGTGDGNNTVTISKIQFGGGGSPTGTPTLVGGVSGNLTLGIVLHDSAFVNGFSQPFTPGSLITFQVSTTTVADGGLVPDQFSFSLLDRNGIEIPTTGKQNFDVLVAMPITGSAPPIQQLSGDSTRSPSAGGAPIVIATPQQGVPVGIDIKPGGDPNPINLRSSGVIPVAILSGSTFSAPLLINRSSLAFGHAGTEKSFRSCDPLAIDVNGDGYGDLVCQFDTETAAFKSGDTIGVLHGVTINGQIVQGNDSIRTIR